MFGLVALTGLATWKTIGLICSVSGAVLEFGSTVSGLFRDDD